MDLKRKFKSFITEIRVGNSMFYGTEPLNELFCSSDVVFYVFTFYKILGPAECQTPVKHQQQNQAHGIRFMV